MNYEWPRLSRQRFLELHGLSMQASASLEMRTGFGSKDEVVFEG